MNWRLLFSEAMASLKHYRRRTIVTIVSLAWGVASFVILMSYGDGFQLALVTAFQAVGQDLVIMGSGQTSAQAGGLRSGRRVQLDLEDVDAIRTAVPLVRAISPELIVSDVQTVRGTREKSYSIRGVLPEYQFIRNMQLVQGRWISDEDGLHRNRVAVLGATVAKELFSEIPPVGEDITLRGQRFTVIGVLDSKGQISNYNRPDNECVFIAYQTAALYGDLRHPSMIVWTPLNGTARNDAVRAVRATLASLHRFAPNDEKAIFILAFSQFMSIIDGMSLAVKILLGFVGTLTLGIGGVGLANIMLAAVIDRTREIGVLKALGGPRRVILGQFLVEGLLIVVAGGILGVLVGAVAVYSIGSMPLFGAMFEDARDKGNIHFQISMSSILVSTGVLFAVGLIAGMIPAIKAARLDPIEALRYE
jgi:putative ABC transport system permease protein